MSGSNLFRRTPLSSGSGARQDPGARPPHAPPRRRRDDTLARRPPPAGAAGAQAAWSPAPARRPEARAVHRSPGSDRRSSTLCPAAREPEPEARRPFRIIGGRPVSTVARPGRQAVEIQRKDRSRHLAPNQRALPLDIQAARGRACAHGQTAAQIAAQIAAQTGRIAAPAQHQLAHLRRAMVTPANRGGPFADHGLPWRGPGCRAHRQPQNKATGLAA